MQKWGKTSAGKQRYRCKHCNSSAIKRRNDLVNRYDIKHFVKWLNDTNHIDDLIDILCVSRSTIFRRFKPLWKHVPKPRHELVANNPISLAIDATSTNKSRTGKLVVLIAQDTHCRKPIYWSFAAVENTTSWQQLMKYCPQPKYVVCDGQKGLLKALKLQWSNTKIQRCLIHITGGAKSKLSNKPRTKAGKELLALIKQIHNVTTHEKRIRWIHDYKKWQDNHYDFLLDRSFNSNPDGRPTWWYTHRGVRAVRSLINNALPNMFLHIDCPVPSTSNHVEGGINSRLKELIKSHRGLSSVKKIVLISWFLALKQGQKPTRNDT